MLVLLGVHSYPFAAYRLLYNKSKFAKRYKCNDKALPTSKISIRNRWLKVLLVNFSLTY